MGYEVKKIVGDLSVNLDKVSIWFEPDEVESKRERFLSQKKHCKNENFERKSLETFKTVGKILSKKKVKKFDS